MVDLDVNDQEIQNMFGAVTAMLGRVPNSYRTLALSPLVAKMLVPFNATVQREGAGSVLSSKLKEMVVIKTSHINQCSYWFAHNTSLGQAAGITDNQVIAIGTDDYLTSGLFSKREKAAILWATHVTLNTAKEENGVFEKVRAEFDEQEIVELTLICSFFNFFNRVMDSLQVPVEEQKEVDKIKNSVHLDPTKVKNYLETTIENWPLVFPKANPDWD
jgi:uncharacterized peroxidase-related enzyme